MTSKSNSGSTQTLFRYIFVTGIKSYTQLKLFGALYALMIVNPTKQ